MYALGKNEYSLIKIGYGGTLYDGEKMWDEIRTVEHGIPCYKATILPTYDQAARLLREIRTNIETIEFKNCDIVEKALGVKNTFDKIEYVKKLTIYRLVPIEMTCE